MWKLICDCVHIWKLLYLMDGWNFSWILHFGLWYTHRLIGMHVHPPGWGANSSQRYKSFDPRARFGAPYNASKTKEYLSKNTCSTTGNRLCFKNKYCSHWNYFSRKFELVAGSTSRVIRYRNFKAISQLNLEEFSGYGLLLERFPGIFLGIPITSIKAGTRNFSQIISKIFN